jgi:hypothetical protein
MKRVTTM